MSLCSPIRYGSCRSSRNSPFIVAFVPTGINIGVCRVTPFKVMVHTLAFPRSLRMLNHSLVIIVLWINNMMSTIYKSVFFTIAILCWFMLSSYSFAQEDELLSCDDVVFSIGGPEAVVLWHDYTFSLSVAIINSSSAAGNSLERIIVPQDILWSASIQYELLFNSRVLQRSSETEFVYQFPELWQHLLRAKVKYWACAYTLEKSIQSYDAIYSYIWPYIDEFGVGIIQNMSQNNLFLRPFIVTDDSLSSSSSLLSTLRQNWSSIIHSKDIYFSLKNYSLIFDVLHLMQQDKSVDLSTKKIFIIDDTNKTIVKKFLARFSRTIEGANIFVLSSQEAMNGFLQLSIGKVSYDQIVLDGSLLQASGPRFSYSFGHIVDYLLFQWFPLDMLVLLLLCVFAVLFIVFCKQVIWISSYGVYYPLIFALSFHVIGLKTSLFLLVMWVIAKMIIIAFTRRFTLLATAKLGLQTVVYIFLTIIGLVVLNMLWFVANDFVIFSNPMVLIAYIIMVVIASKIWTASFVSISVKQLWSFSLFLLVSYVSYLIIQSESLRHIVLLYPSFVLFAIILLIALWRYTWLQFMEIIRFWPLIRHLRSKK